MYKYRSGTLYSGSLFAAGKFCLLGILLVLSSCSGSDAPSTPSGYFDAAAYFTGEAKRLGEVNMQVQKVSDWNGKKDSASVRVADWKKELEPFIQCSLHKPSMRNRYTVDSSWTGGKLEVTYISREEKLPVRKMEVTRDGQHISRITVVTGDTNLVYALRRELTYVPDSGYIIRGRQDIQMMSPADYMIKASWK